RQLSREGQHLHRRSAVRGRRAAPRHVAAAGRAHRPHRCRVEGAPAMTVEPGPGAPEGDGVAREPLELRARPRPVTRINRRLLVGVAGLGLFFLAGLVMVALNPPSWRSSGPPTELYNVDNKPKSDGLSRLPATYEGIGTTRVTPD